MQLRRLAVLALAVAVAACGDDGPATIDPADARVQIVSGDRQTARVPSPAPQGALVPTAVVGEALLPEPLVVRVVDGAGSISAAISIAGPSAAIVPAGTALHWRVVESGCGWPYGATTLTDDSAYSVNRVIIGTTARECSVEVGRVLRDGEIVVDSVFRYTLLPGPASRWSLEPLAVSVSPGDTIDIRQRLRWVRDAHGNEVPLATLDSAEIGWAWTPLPTLGGDIPAEPQGSGWLTVVPDEAATWPELVPTRNNAVVRLWINGTLDPNAGLLARVVPAD